MAGFDRRRRLDIDTMLRYSGRGSIEAALYDLGIYPAAVPTRGSRVWGEVFETDQVDDVLAALDEIEGYRAGDPDGSLYVREKAPTVLPDGRTVEAWVYFYNAPLGQAPLIPSGDYLEHVRAR